MSENTTTVRNDYGARLSGGPAGRTIEAGEEVDLDPEVADYYVENYGFTKVDSETDEPDTEVPDGEEPEPGETVGDVDENPTVTVDGEERTIGDLSYRELQAVAREYDDVAANQSASDLRATLSSRVEE